MSPLYLKFFLSALSATYPISVKLFLVGFSNNKSNLISSYDKKEH